MKVYPRQMLELLRLLGGGRSAAGLEFLHAAGSVDNLVVAGIERVALAADFHIELLGGRTERQFSPASTGNDRTGVICRMSISLHG